MIGRLFETIAASGDTRITLSFGDDPEHAVWLEIDTAGTMPGLAALSRQQAADLSAALMRAWNMTYGPLKR